MELVTQKRREEREVKELPRWLEMPLSSHREFRRGHRFPGRPCLPRECEL